MNVLQMDEIQPGPFSRSADSVDAWEASHNSESDGFSCDASPPDDYSNVPRP